MLSNNLCLGLAAHVDAGKTTLAESILFNTGAIRKQGRVDHGDSFLDNLGAERARGITIFAKQALFKLGAINYTLMDTPGHADFLPEFERVLPVLDACILIISAPDGVTAHDRRLWSLLEKQGTPTLVFVNKMDRALQGREESLAGIKEALGYGVVDMEGLAGAAADGYAGSGGVRPADNGAQGGKAGRMADPDGQAVDVSNAQAVLNGLPENIKEDIATLDEEVMERYLADGSIHIGDVRRLFLERKLVPCCFGSALKGQGTGELLSVIERIMEPVDCPDELGAIVFKISRDARGRKLVHIRLTGGRLRPRDEVTIRHAEEACGHRQEGAAGSGGTMDPCSIMGHGSAAGQGSAVSTGGTAGPGGIAVPGGAAGMGCIVKDGGSPAGTGSRSATIIKAKADQVLSVNGKNIKQTDEAVAGMCVAVTGLDGAWIGDGLGYEEGRGIGIREPGNCTDEGSDEYAAGGLRRVIVPDGGGDPYKLYLKLESLKEELPETNISYDNDNKVINASFRGVLQEEVFAGLVRERCGEGIASLDAASFYEEVERRHLEEERLRLESLYLELYGGTAAAAEAVKDLSNEELNEILASGGTYVQGGLGSRAAASDGGAGFAAVDGCGVGEAAGTGSISRRKGKGEDYLGEGLDRDRELEAIFLSTAGRNANRNKQKQGDVTRERRLMRETERLRKDMPFVSVPDPKERYLIVDGYNIIYAWKDLNEAARLDINAARGMLADMLANYQGYRGMTLIIVFDAYRVPGGTGSVERYHNIYIVYTKEAQTADAYIEKAVHELSDGRIITVATNDALEQTIIFGEGASRMSARELKDELDECSMDIYRSFLSKKARLENRMKL